MNGIFTSHYQHAVSRFPGTFRTIVVLFLLLCSSGCSVLPQVIGPAYAGDADPRPKHDTTWMYQGKFGLGTHYFALRPEDNEQLARNFDVKKVADQVADSGAAWFLFSMHHRPWIMMAPNATFDRIVGTGIYTAERDVPLELIPELKARGVKLMLYVNLRLDPESAAAPLIREKMGGWPPSDKLVENIAAVWREYSLRYGTNVAGWWVDAAGRKEFKLSPDRERWFKIIADALRAGNPEAIVAFNPGVRTMRYTDQEDYTAGETEDLKPMPSGRFLDGSQWHIWTYLGGWWGSGGTRFSDQELGEYLSRVISRGGAVTLDVGTLGFVKDGRDSPREQTPDTGHIDPAQIEQILRIRSLFPLRRTPGQGVANPAAQDEQLIRGRATPPLRRPPEREPARRAN
jgi:hypothetical protein